MANSERSNAHEKTAEDGGRDKVSGMAMHLPHTKARAGETPEGPSEQDPNPSKCVQTFALKWLLCTVAANSE